MSELVIKVMIAVASRDPVVIPGLNFKCNLPRVCGFPPVILSYIHRCRHRVGSQLNLTEGEK